ncbi:Uncharacterised protein [Mycobacteroides abscessus subsp. massiliense]|uniref:hypothetical protein n=1 Tax=Mycobacteroides abscessus TaxID=36809 RepID=UPI0002585B90|nr:hypothetical protein [Mycobacteroides abscessus]EIC63614.1 hypothetical protein OUW_20561 [Mycobacteroides abscessus M93]SKN09768.1 Uncharacterised protein [Mycobacteroides abscessus subsp. massiliense]
MDTVEKIILPLIALLSGWMLAMWKTSRHRNWDSLSSDLELADKMQDHFPEYAAWLRKSVAVRLKGRAILDSRPRLDLLQAAVGGAFVAAGLGGIAIFSRDASQATSTPDAYGNLFFTLAMLLTVIAGVTVLVRNGLTAAYRVPGVSDLLLPGSTKAERDKLKNEFKQLNSEAKQLPEVKLPPNPLSERENSPEPDSSQP